MDNDIMTASDTISSSHLLSLPGEIRELIYYQVLCSADNTHHQDDGYKRYKYDLALLRVNRQIYYEARKIFRQNNVFVSVETPWPEAQHHVAIEGYVPILITNERAERFTNCHLAVKIDAPQFQQYPRHPRKFIILLEDLHTFCEMWFYSDLTHPRLNSNLRLTLHLKDPYALEFEHKLIPKALQKKLLEPFGLIKDLYDVKVEGEHYDSLVKSMKDAMTEPYMSVEECLEKATKLKDEGNEALRQTKYREAIHLYEQSFLAIHIVCEGRRRSIWADAFFQKEIRSGTFKDQHAQLVRLFLRVRLVANIIQAYLKLNEYEEAEFWGMRSINLFRGTREIEEDEEDEAVLAFPAATEMGKVYYRTGVASKALGNKERARSLMKVAIKYLPSDQVVQRDLASLAPRLG